MCAKPSRRVSNTPSDRRRVAEQLCSLYHDALRTTVSQTAGAPVRLVSRDLDSVDATSRRSFLKAATSCIELGADPREFVVAQFSAFRNASAYHKKFLLPQPSMFASLGARVRYLQFKATSTTRLARRPPEAEDRNARRRFFVEERELKGLARMQRRDPSDVLTETPERFSREFLEHKGVWDVVRDIWEERR